MVDWLVWHQTDLNNFGTLHEIPELLLSVVRIAFKFKELKTCSIDVMFNQLSQRTRNAHAKSFHKSFGEAVMLIKILFWSLLCMHDQEH